MKSKALKELCFPNKCGIYGIPASAEDFDETKIRYLRITDISEDGKLLDSDKKSVSDSQIEKYLLEEGDIVFARTGNSTGKSYFHEIKNGELAFAGFLIKFSLDPEKVNPKYLRYYTITKHYKQWVENFSLGSTRGNLNANSFGNCPIPIPSRKQQDFLVKVLSDLDAKIEVNNKINQELEEIAKTIYDYWFVQFDFPDANGKPYKASGGKMVYNEALKREIPEGWEVRSVSGFADCNKWNITKESRYDKINYLDTSSLTENVIDSFQKLDFDRDKIPSRAQRIVSKNDILYSTVRPNQLHYGIIKRPIENLIASTGFAQIRSNDSKITNDFIFQILSQDYVSARLQQIAVGSVSAYPSISHNDIMELKIALPLNDELINKATSIFCQYNDKVALNLEENQKLAELRDWLLPMLMNGQVTVGEAKEELGMVAEENAKYVEV
ncbi:restriction endonuclease subunit S [uncultured Lacinutrix sp.]|uniref:restriction endonuclease subunit S n=1 Tax=uncultured Lacinutrix sp. TaxID=574032 RepID=UPI0026274864|nr:restriction endonuclease subunit S [uncultured Lacinutrix sp.]